MDEYIERFLQYVYRKNTQSEKTVEAYSRDLNQLKNFLSESDGSAISVEDLSLSTGVSLKNVNRFLQNKDLFITLTNLGLNSENSFNNNINLM